MLLEFPLDLRSERVFDAVAQRANAELGRVCLPPGPHRSDDINAMGYAVRDEFGFCVYVVDAVENIVRRALQ